MDFDPFVKSVCSSLRCTTKTSLNLQDQAKKPSDLWESSTDLSFKRRFEESDATIPEEVEMERVEDAHFIETDSQVEYSRNFSESYWRRLSASPSPAGRAIVSGQRAREEVHCARYEAAGQPSVSVAATEQEPGLTR